MTKKDLQFMLAYAEVHELMNAPFYEVYEDICRLFGDEGFASTLTPDEYIDDFMEHYNAMKENHLENEIHETMHLGYPFFGACQEWDI